MELFEVIGPLDDDNDDDDDGAGINTALASGWFKLLLSTATATELSDGLKIHKINANLFFHTFKVKVEDKIVRSLFIF